MLKIMKFMLLGYTILLIFVKTKVGIAMNNFNKNECVNLNKSRTLGVLRSIGKLTMSHHLTR
jgi:hypothetical protein